MHLKYEFPRQVHLYCIDRQVEFSKGKIPIFESAQNGHTVKRFESTEDNYSGSTMVISTTKMYYHHNIMHHKVAMCKDVTLCPCTQVRDRVMNKIFVFIHFEAQEAPADRTPRLLSYCDP